MGRHFRSEGLRKTRAPAVKRIQDAPLNSADQAENQAAAWLVRLDADNSAETMKHWHTWMKQDVRRRAAFVRLERSWRQTDCLQSLKPLDGTVNPNVLDTFPGVTPTAARSKHKPKVAYGELAIQTLAVALAAGMLAGKLVASCWLFINPDGPG
jgi:ferric-dicitrate binding protein FerR (iron transport regulator)